MNILSIKDRDFWYCIGVIATDGCLTQRHGTIDITSKDRDYVYLLKSILKIKNKISLKYNSYTTKKYYHVQWCHHKLYDFLISIGITPKKSLTIGKLDIPKKYFIEFLRGVIDGNGSVNISKHPQSQYLQWSLRIYSGSEKFIYWLKEKIEEYFKTYGSIGFGLRHVIWLKFGKTRIRKLLQLCYYNNCIGLKRKIKKINICLKLAGWGN